MSAPERERLVEDDLSARGALSVLGRAIRYVGPFRGPFVVKGFLVFLSLLPMLILPWPIKIILDHVIIGVPLDSPVQPFPPFVRPFTDLMLGMSSGEILAWTFGFMVLLFVTCGSFGTHFGERDAADAGLATGHDTATRTENEANEGWSFAGGLLGLLDYRFTLRLTQALNHRYRSQLFQRIQALPMTAFHDERIGDAVYRVMYDTPAITNAIYRILLTPVLAPIYMVITSSVIAVSFPSDPLLFWAAISLLPTALIASLPFATAFRRVSGESRKAGATTTSTAEEGMANILAVQSLGGEERQRSRFDDDSWTSFGRYRGVFVIKVAGTICSALPGFVLLVIAFFGVADRVIAGELSVGDFTLLFTYFFRMAWLALEGGLLWFRMQENAAGLHRVFFLMDMPGEQDAPGAKALPRPTRGVSIERVGFSYPDGTPALNDVSLEAPIGRMIALVGPAGAGKTTLAFTVPRFVEPTHGRVCIDGTDIANVTRESLRSHISFVFQETVLFDGTVEDNVRLGKPDATPAELDRAARLAGALEFIERLPQGWQTPLGRSGGKLSTGQKQRLAIARALVRDAPILILDEPTSALDPRTERQLVETLEAVRRERLVIVIAHRLSTIRAADQIAFVRGGEIVERGTHDELIATEGGAYRRFVELQTRGAA